MDKKVKEYIEKQDKLKKTLLKKSRKLILDNIPKCKEEFKWGVPVYDEGKLKIFDPVENNDFWWFGEEEKLQD